MDPLLKWVGSKRWHVPAVKALYASSGRRVVEPFCGGASISFGLEPPRALLNDANPHLINFYKQVRRGDQAVLARDGDPVRKPLFWEFDLSSSEALYYDYRTWFNRLAREGRAQSPDAAQLFFYLNHHGYGGLCRFNKKGEFNVPFGAGRNCPAHDWAAVKHLLTGWTFTCDDFSDVLLEPDDFVYADPPYDGTFGDYTEGGWSRDQMESLAMLLRAHPGPVVLMNSATPWITSLLGSLGYQLTLQQSGQGIHRGQGRSDVVPELMAVNFAVDPRGNIVVT